ncbi:hypothetical protein B0H13DRAFT_2567488 [Mycena leptocephala]|nr:hypothetical protein B0H13DRAFT_2567488 [Mycena leptocephala]
MSANHHNLDSLRDGPPGSKPCYPYSTLIRYAIKGSPNQKLLLEDIYYAIQSRFPYFRTAPNGWKNSIRHNLSLNPSFEKVPRPLTDRGKGSYWTVNNNVDPRTGVHRTRKKKTKCTKGRSLEEDGVEYHPPDGRFDESQYTLAESGASHQSPPFPGAAYEPAPLWFMDMPPPGCIPEENLELNNENGKVDWRVEWLKEIGHLQQVTVEQEKANVEPEWYRMMLFRVPPGTRGLNVRENPGMACPP